MKLFVGAGEASGDRIAALILGALRSRHPDLVVVGFGGPLCAAQGLTSPYTLADLAVNGLGDVLRRGPSLLRARANLLRNLESMRPDLVLLVDYPGMNIPLARRARALGIPVHYVAPPQLWAYKDPRHRLARLRRVLDKDRDETSKGVSLQVLFPFESKSYPDWKTPISQGHFFPLPAFESAPERGGTRLLLCPGSRRGVLRRNLPLWLARVRFFFGTLEGVDILVPDYLENEARSIASRADFKEVRILTDREAAFASAGAAIAFPGTMTLELFLHRIPTRVWAVLDPLTLWVGRRKLHGPHIALPNVIAGKECFPEWIGTASDFRREPPEIPEVRDAWAPTATAEAVHAVWTHMGSDQGVEIALEATTRL